jgi:hypothetical protein
MQYTKLIDLTYYLLIQLALIATIEMFFVSFTFMFSKANADYN